jgi:(2Fe-2S) ferredoxin
MPISKDKAIGFVAGRLAKKEAPEEVIPKLASYGNMTWEDAEKIVNEVHTKRPGAVARRRLFGKLIIGLLMLAAGLYLVMLNGRLLVELFNITPPFYETYRGDQLPLYGEVYNGRETIQFYIGLGLAAFGSLQLLLSVLSSLRP